MNITELTVHELQDKLANKEITITQITEAYANRIKEKENDVQAFVTVLTDDAKIKAKEIEEKVKANNKKHYAKEKIENTKTGVKQGTTEIKFMKEIEKMITFSEMKCSF